MISRYSFFSASDSVRHRCRSWLRVILATSLLAFPTCLPAQSSIGSFAAVAIDGGGSV